jgi:hypothetical protein
MHDARGQYLAIAVTVCYGIPFTLAVGDEPKDVKWIPLPTQGQLCVLPAEYQMPYTQRGMIRRIETRNHLFRENEERGVYLRDDQVIGFCCQGSGDLEFLAGVPDGQLRDLSLLATRLSDGGVVQLKRFRGLSHLSVGLDNIDNIETVLTAVPHLQAFSLASPSCLVDPATARDEHFFPNEGFKYFVHLPNIRSVRIFSPLLSDQALRLAAKLPKLEVLDIEVESIDVRKPRLITDDGLKALATAKQLREIVLQVGPKCTDEGVKELLKLEHLEWIEIQGIEKVEPATVEALKAKFPDAHIEFKPRVSR